MLSNDESPTNAMDVNATNVNVNLVVSSTIQSGPPESPNLALDMDQELDTLALPAKPAGTLAQPQVRWLQQSLTSVKTCEPNILSISSRNKVIGDQNIGQPKRKRGPRPKDLIKSVQMNLHDCLSTDISMRRKAKAGRPSKSNSTSKVE